MNKTNKSNSMTLVAASLITAGLAMPGAGLAASFPNPSTGIAAAEEAFSMDCVFEEYDADGAYSKAHKMQLLPASQVFHFAGPTVRTEDGRLAGYVLANSEIRGDWRMGTGKTGSPFYRFVFMKQSGVVNASILTLDQDGKQNETPITSIKGKCS